MGKVILDMSMSLDGYIATADGKDGGLNDWYFSPPEKSKAIVDEMMRDLGVIIMGRKTFDEGDAHNAFDDSPFKIPHFILTHRPRETKDSNGSSYTFVTDGIESALKQAQAVVKDGFYIAIGGGARVAQQYLEAGLVDEIQIHQVHVLFGSGVRLFGDSGMEATPLERVRVIDSRGVTHLKYRIVK
ncbi:MAG: dihydrofolate reductase family protein [Aggregatilineales bacterium]